VIRVLLADDHALVRAGLAALVRDLPGIEVVAEAGDGREALALIARHRPNVVLMDVAMPGLNGLEAAARIAREFPGVHVIVLSAYGDEEYVLAALRAGATGYLLKGASPQELELAITAAARGEAYLTPATSRHVVEDYRRRAAGDAGAPAALTPRQREILQLVAEGKSSKEIAVLLDLSVKAVESHRGQIMERLGVHDLTGLVRFAIRIGLVSPES
jgi:DNA-binding NarL/FixJ family response regulator